MKYVMAINYWLILQNDWLYRLINCHELGSRQLRIILTLWFILSLSLTIISRANLRLGNEDFGYGKIQSTGR